MRTQAPPVIEHGAARTGKPGAADAVAVQLRDACERVGFYFPVDHGIDLAPIEAAFAAKAAFFDSPLEQKPTLRIDHQQSGFQTLEQSLIRGSPPREARP